MDSRRHAGNVIAIAGGTTGIGASTASRLAAEGAQVVIGGRNVEAADALVADIRDRGGQACSVRVDISVEAQARELIQVAVDTYGRLDGLFNNAAAIEPANLGADTDPVTIPNSVWERTLAVNLTGFMYTIRAAVPELLRAGGGSILNTTSEALYRGEPVRLAYAVSKAGVVALSANVSGRWGRDGIRSNCISPGPVLTAGGLANMNQEHLDRLLAAGRLSRLGLVEDVSALAAFLLSNESQWITGQTYRVNGGQSVT